MKHMIRVKGSLSDDHKTILLNHSLDNIPSGKVKLLIIQDDEENSDEEWLQAASKSTFYDDLKSPAEDIYTIQDGMQYNQEAK